MGLVERKTRNSRRGRCAINYRQPFLGSKLDGRDLGGRKCIFGRDDPTTCFRASTHPHIGAALHSAANVSERHQIARCGNSASIWYGRGEVNADQLQDGFYDRSRSGGMATDDGVAPNSHNASNPCRGH